MSWLKPLFPCRHDWAFALGVSPGVMTSQPRPLCFRRACVKRGQREEIMHYQSIYRHEGIDYMAQPQWVPSQPNA